jgi:asparagine synthase (glutamine-hydrolysing)
LKYHLSNISQPIHVYALEFLEREAIRHKIVSRYPYFDIRLLEFCLAMPAVQKFRSGTNRNIVRRALRDVLPDSIRLRKDKTNFAPSMLHAFLQNDQEWLVGNIDNLYCCSYDYISKSSLCSANNNFMTCESKKLLDLSTLLTSVCFARWLVKNKEMQRVVSDSKKHS